ncbi:hypothetical protein RCOM_0229940 [Ricinus communis]|uniref:Pentatricopeptide repeat-containing protein n=1 Tax=Ricinus communis TaxID=3988 RepID=B9T808_RICCO|nr:hypothetical protein RCOM_0229940 [Ricinus communis]
MYPDEEAYPFVLASCSSLLDVVNGKVIHGHLTKLGFESFYLLGAALIEMYGSSADFENERHVDNGKSSCDLSYWNSLIFEASKTGNIKESFLFYKKMRMEKVIPDSVTNGYAVRSIELLRNMAKSRAVEIY